MSRIGNKLITIPAGVTLDINGRNVHVKGPKGELDVLLNEGITAEVEGTNVSVKRANDEKQIKQNHGTSRANLHNAIVGVSEGYTKTLVMIGIGYKAVMHGEDIEIFAGYSHTITIKPEKGVKLEVKVVANNNEIYVSGIDKQAVGQTAALIRNIRRPEPYLGKGIRYKGEHIALKEGKRATAGKK